MEPVKYVIETIMAYSRPYGGYTLQAGDDDGDKKWGGRTEENWYYPPPHKIPEDLKKKGGFVKELQEDLVELGYWVSGPKSNSDEIRHGVDCDGDFGGKTRGAVVTFQREHKGELNDTGKVDKDTAYKIKNSTLSNKWSRPANPTKGFYQLPPSEETVHYSPKYDNLGMIDDIWGTKKLVDTIRETAHTWWEWYGEPIYVGDMCAHDGRNINHQSHRDGTDVDIGRVPCNILGWKGTDFKPLRALELAKLFLDKGAVRVLFNCKFIHENLEGVYPLADHHHHFHVDVSGKSDMNRVAKGAFCKDKSGGTTRCQHYNTCLNPTNSEKNKFCMRCGRSLEPPAGGRAKCPDCDDFRPPSPEVVKCYYCRSVDLPLSRAVLYCGSCGKEQPERYMEIKMRGKLMSDHYKWQL